MKLTPRLQKAIIRSSMLHAGQTRKDEGNVPYVSHPFSVAIILSRYTDDEDILIASLMHDSVEDVKGYNYEDLATDFGWKIANLVRDISEFKHDPESKKATWLDRKQKYLNKLDLAHRESLMVCAADKIHNLQSLIDHYKIAGPRAWHNFDASIEQKIWFYEEVLKILKQKLHSGIVRELNIVCQQAKIVMANSLSH